MRRPGNQPNNADLRYLTVEQAETETGITQQQVSRWRKWLRTEEKYQEALYGAAWRKAMERSAARAAQAAHFDSENLGVQ